ncbi:MAG: hypothetical protein CMJ52_02160 [Planctomycetaceae bacterium]|nr:hypothetical protein [Planctomycetaceae bacterium]
MLTFKFSLFEFTEIFLNKICCIEFADSDVIIARRWDDLIEQFHRGSLPNLLNDRSKFFICLVNISFGLDFQRRTNQCK